MSPARALASAAAWVAFACAPGASWPGESASVDARIAAHLADLQAGLDPRAANALGGIEGLDRRLLAARSYLRSQAAIDERWSWSQAQIERFEGSPLRRALDQEIARVRAAFEAQNPGYTLWVNPQVRSIEVQLARWNDNPTVGVSAQSLLEQLRQRVSREDAQAVASTKGREWFAEVLREAVPRPTPPLAAPGLSRHGRMQAVDFHVMQGDRTVAGPSQAEIAAAWEAEGWRVRLERAVRSASDRFEGPLVTPNEPWHYEYRAPDLGAADSAGADD